MDLYLIAVIVLLIIAALDITVGVANDAVNFLAPGYGSRLTSFKVLLWSASLGVFIGALFSGGMIDVARSGAFHPETFTFHEILLIYFAVVISDIILLDLFNTAGLPTSTTVSLISELVGAGFAMGLIKIYAAGDAFNAIVQYVNESRILGMFTAILVSVPLAFGLGWFMQYISRLIFTFVYDKKVIIGALFSGISVAFISYFIFVKGLKNAFFLTSDVKTWILDHLWMLGIGTVLLVAFMLIVVRWLNPRFNIYKVVVLYGTFAVAMAFAGNDLVNFIGPSVASIESYLLFSSSGASSPHEYFMSDLVHVKNPFLPYILLGSGIIMMLALWFNKKLMNVLETSTQLSNQSEVSIEKFEPNDLARAVIRFFVFIQKFLDKFIPKSIQRWIDSRFEQKATLSPNASFDAIRAAVVTMVGSSLIALGTSLNLPLSTTYVTFLVAMGAALGDRAWNQDTAIYRVSGVFYVIGGWFLTAFFAFLLGGIVVLFLYFTTWIGMLILLALLIYILIKTKKVHEEISGIQKESNELLQKSLSADAKEFLDLVRSHISSLIYAIQEILKDIEDGILNEKLKSIKEARKKFKVLDNRSSLFINAVNLHISEKPELGKEVMFMKIANIQREIAVSLSFVVQALYKHFNNQHKNFSEQQLEDIKEILSKYYQILDSFEKLNTEGFSYSQFELLSQQLNEMKLLLSEVRRRQLERLKKKDVGTRTNLLFFNNLSEFENQHRLLEDLVKCQKEMYPYW